MAIDTTLFRATIPAGTYAVGDRFSLSVIRGPSVVRDGYGPAYLKRFSAIHSGGMTGHVTIKNSNWDDSAANLAPNPGATVLSNNSNAIQSGHDCPLQVNSGWEVEYVLDAAVTTTSSTDIFSTIDVDYPTVQAVANPRVAKGTPSTNMRLDNVTITAIGSTLVWTTYNVDILKAGYKYLLASAAFRGSGTLGFLSISGAAGQNGLERIILVVPNSLSNLRYELDYSTPLVKGPFNINYAEIGTAGTEPIAVELDWVKKR